MGKNCFVIFLFFISKNIWAQNFRFVAVNGYEVEMIGAQPIPDRFYGIIPAPSSETEVIKYMNGKETLRYKYSIDLHGVRKSAASHRLKKSKHVLLFGGSQVFGENLNDDQTLAHKINERSRDYEAYPLAYFGYGPNHAWLRLDQNGLKNLISQKKGSAFIFTHENDINRFFGKPEHLLYAAEHPQIVESAFGHFSYAGSFQTSGTFFQKLIIKFCVPYLFCRNLAMGSMSDVTDEELQIISRLFKDIEKKYKEQFNVERFVIVWSGDSKYVAELQKLTSMEIVSYQIQQKFVDDHPKAGAYDRFIDDLFYEKTIK